MEKWLEDSKGTIWWCIKVGAIIGLIWGIIDFIF